MKWEIMGNKGVKRGVSAYSYTEQYGITMNLEDVFEEMLDIVGLS